MPRNTVPFEPTDEQRQLVSILVASGTSQDLIRKFIINPATRKPIAKQTLADFFKHELENGLTLVNAKMGLSVAQKGLAGDTACQFFWLKTKAGWRETARFDLPKGLGAIEQYDLLLQKAAAGEISPTEGEQFANIVNKKVGALTLELLKRIEALEAKSGDKR